MLKSRSIAVFVLVAALAALVAGCGSSSSSSSGSSSSAETGESTTAASNESSSESSEGGGKASGEPIVIGVAAALTGAIEGYDVPPINGLKMAVKDFNAEGGIAGRPVKLVFSDTQSEINKGPQAAQNVIGQGAEIVISSCDYDYGGPAARVANEQGIVAFSLCAGSPLFGVQGIGPYAFSMGTATPIAGGTMAVFAKEKGYKKPFILEDTTTQYSKSVCAAFEEQWEKEGGEFAGKATFQNEDSSIATQTSEIRSADPDSVVACTLLPGGPGAIRQIRQAGIEVPILGFDALDGNFWQKAIPNLSDMYIDTSASAFGGDPNPEINKFMARYEKEFGSPSPDGLSVLGYAIGQVLKQGIEEDGETTEGEALKNKLQEATNWKTLQGPVSFTETLHIPKERAERIMQITGNKLKPVTTITLKDPPFPPEFLE
jgi:branched-chain amino acid transport system substrate-binding protein